MNTLVRRNGLLPSTSFIDEFLRRDFFDRSGWITDGGTVPQVNIVETNDDFRVEMAAPGMNRNDFRIELENDMLTISSDRSYNEGEDNHNFTRREFNYQSFERSFHIPNTVEVDKINATYRDGMLRLVIPKKDEAKRKPARTIKIT